MSIAFTRRVVAVICLALCASAGLLASGARFWQVSTQADFLEGEVDTLSIDQHGRLVLGPDLTLASDSATPFLWTLLHGPDGSVYAGTGNDGQVLRFSAKGERSVFFDSPELEVHALAAAPNGGLYVGTSPDGKIYRVDAKGASSVYFDPEDKYIWALATDSSGALYAATGEKGLIYRITDEGKGEVFYRTKSTHARTLLVDGKGDLLAGTEAPGKVFRIRTDGTGFVLLDSGLQEISALRVGENGVVYATALTGKPAPGAEERGPDREAEPDRSVPIPSVSTEITAMTVIDIPSSSGPTAQPRQARRTPPKGGVYRIMPDGAWDVMWELTDDVPYDLLPEPGGSMLVATGNEGKIYRLSGDPVRVTLLTRADAQQVTRLMRDGDGRIWVASSNPGKLYRLSSRQATKGSYESEIRDAETVATWGAISWRGSAPNGTSVKLYTRSGNTSVPDETWSEWSSAYTKASGEQITSPKARYLQWKLQLTGTESSTAMVTSVTAAYLQRNLRPLVSSITIHPPGLVFQKPFSTGDAEIAGFDGTTSDRRASQQAQSSLTQSVSPSLGRRSFQKGLQTIGWKADDDNDDDLSYDVMYRREGETTWKALKRNLTDAIFVWDTTSVPNGTYIVKIVASDSPSNPPGTALNGERESRSFEIDNLPPSITVTAVRRDGPRTIVSFTVEDDSSPVQRVEYSLDADRWRTIYPKDGIADSLIEQFELTLDGDITDKAVILRALDTMNNVATGRAEMARPATR